LSDVVNHRRGVDLRAAAAGRSGAVIGTCVPVVAELHYGLEMSASRDPNIRQLQVALRRLRVWPFDIRAAEEYGRLYAELIRRGRPMQQIDVMIAAVALSLGNCTVVTTDSDLSAVPGLAVENWAA
jgi:tRNA(fMet)-specific endonuclease VapC